MENDKVHCFIYRSASDESDGETVTLSMLIPSQRVMVPNKYQNVFLLSNLRKLALYEKVYERFGNPPEQLMLPDIEEIRNEAEWNENSCWTFVHWNILFEEHDVITTLKTIKEAAKPIQVNSIVIPLSDRASVWIQEFANVIQEFSYYDNYTSIIAETA